MAEIKITIEESGEPITGLVITDFEGLPFEIVSCTEVEPGVYLFVKED